MTQIFSDWTVTDLKGFKKKLEEMLVSGVRQSTFKDQTLIFSSRTEIRVALNELIDAINAREEQCGGGGGSGSSRNKKQVRVTTTNKGFR